jgi:hypothetical protein
MEYESWTNTIYIPWLKYDPLKPKLNLPNLEPTTVQNNDFKRADVHFTAKKISYELENELLNKGFYYADFVNKMCENQLHRVFTIQTSSVRDVKLIQKIVLNHILQVGGFEGESFLEPVLKYVRTENHQVPPKSSVKIN